MGNIKSFCCRDSVSEIDDREERARILSDNNASTTSIYNQSSNSGQDDLSYGSVTNGMGSKTMEQSALDKIYQRMAANVIDVAPGESMIIQPAEFIERQKVYQARLSQIKTPLPLRSNNKVPRQLNNSTIDTRINTSVTSANANFSPLGQLGINTSVSNHTSDSNNLNVGYTMNTTGSSTLTANSSNTTSSNSPQHVTKGHQEKRRVEYEPISAEDLQLINEISDKAVKAIKELRVSSQEPVLTRFQP